jgi:hypothetical protein
LKSTTHAAVAARLRASQRVKMKASRDKAPHLPAESHAEVPHQHGVGKRAWRSVSCAWTSARQR